MPDSSTSYENTMYFDFQIHPSNPEKRAVGEIFNAKEAIHPPDNYFL